MTEPRAIAEPARPAVPLRPYLAWTLVALLLMIALLGRIAVPPAPPVPDDYGPAGFVAGLPALLLCGFLPGWWIAGSLGLAERYARLAAAVVLSSLLVFAVGLAWLATGLSGMFTLVLTFALLPAAEAVARVRTTDLRRVRLSRPGWSAFALAAWVLLVVAVYAANPELRFRIDGWFHGAVTGRLLAAGLPLDDPYFAGQRLAYPWAWHVLLAATMQLGARLGVSAFDALAGWSALAALAVGALLVALGRAWAAAGGLDARGQDRAGGLALAAAVVATNPLGVLFSLGRGMIGNEAGLAHWLAPFGRGATEVLYTTTWSFPHVSLASFVDKFLTPTAFGLGEAAFLAGGAVLLLDPPTGEGRRRAVILAVAAGAFAWLIHGAAAGALVLVAACSVAVLARAESGRRRAGLLVLALAAGAVVALPYLAATRGGGGGGVRFGLQADLLWSMLVVGGVVLVLAAVERRRLPAAPDGRHAWFAGAILLLATAALVTLVQRNETKLVNLGLLALAVPAGVAWARLPARAAVVLLVLLVPTHALAVAGFLLDRGQDAPGRRVPPPALAASYAWIGAHTGARDLFLEAQPAPARDPDRDLVVHGPRAIVWGGEGYARNWGYGAADLELRARAARELAAGRLSTASVRDLAARARRGDGQLYAVRRGRDAAAAGAPGAGRWTRVHAGPALALDRLDAAPGPSGGPR